MRQKIRRKAHTSVGDIPTKTQSMGKWPERVRVMTHKVINGVWLIHIDIGFRGAEVLCTGNVVDGYSEGKDINIVLLDVKKGKYAKLSKPQTEIKRAVDAKRIKWKTLNLE